jgi:hypothetical protein
MNDEEAKRQLQLHLGVLDEGRRGWVLEDGFVTGLRPYKGLNERNIHQVMEALLTIGEHLHRSAEVDRDLVYTVWSMCYTIAEGEAT